MGGRRARTLVDLAASSARTQPGPDAQSGGAGKPCSWPTERAAQNQIKAAKEAAARREVEDRAEARNGPRNIERGPSPRATSHSPDPLTGATKIITGIQG